MSGTVKGAVLVLDAAGCIGRGVVAAAIEQGRAVIAVAPDRAGLRALKALHPDADLSLLEGSTADEAKAAALVRALRELDRPLADIVNGSGCREPVRGRVLEQGSEEMRRRFEDEVLPQLAAAQALVPLLAEAGRNGSYVVIGGPGSEQPWAGYGHRSICAASNRMLLRVLHDEAHSLAVRVHLLAVETPARTEENDGRACAQWPSTQDIGLRALELLDPAENQAPIEAVVRYAWPQATAAAVRRTARPADRRATRSPSHMRANEGLEAKTEKSAPTPARASHETAPHDPSPIPSLDDTWALLKPLLANHSKKGSTP